MASKSLQTDDFQPKVIFIKRKPNQGFGFTLRHFIAYPPESWNTSGVKAMETIFIKEVHIDGPAYLAGLQTGDRLLTVNDEPIAGVPYSVIVSRIKQTPYVLKLEVVSKECDVLQMYYTDIAHNPESNRYRDKNKFALLNYVPSSSSINNNNGSGSNNFNTIPRKTLSFPATGNNTTTPINPSTAAAATTIHHQMTKFSNSNLHPELRNKFKFNEKFSNLGTPNFNFATLPHATTTTFSNSNNSCDFMARLRKSIEQKEEFLKAAPQNYPSSFFKTLKSSDNPKRIISSGDKVNNFYTLNSMGFSRNPKGEDENDDEIKFRFTGEGGGGGGGIGLGIGGTALALPAVATGETIKDVHYDEQNLYGGIKKNIKFNKAIEKLKPVSPITLGIPSTEPLSLCRVPPQIFDKLERKIEMKTTINLQNKNSIKAGTSGLSEQSNNVEIAYKHDNDLECMKSDDCITSLQNPTQVLRRYRTTTGNDENKVMRRISYLRATNNDEDGFRIDVNPELMNFEEKLENCDKENKCKKSNDLQLTKSQDATEPTVVADMEIKSSSIFGKRLTEYRSWRHVKVELKGDKLKIFTGRNINKSDTNIIELNLKNYEISEDISSRRKYVFKLQSTMNAQKMSILTDELQQQQQQQQINKSDGSNSSSTIGSVQFTEIYFKCENSNEMKKWIELLKSRMVSSKKKNDIIIALPPPPPLSKPSSSSENNGKQLAEPQKTAATSSVSTSEYPDDTGRDFKQSSVMIPPISVCPVATTTITTTTVVPENKQQQQDNETESSSNSVCSPVIKTRKSDKSDKDLGSPKSKNWRDLLFRKGGGSSGGSSSASSSGSGIQMGNSCRTGSGSGGSIGFPLKSCPMSKDNEYVPYIVDVCTKIVESKGLNVVGIYRIPGNKAAISELKDQVNRNDFMWNKIDDDIRWEDVNVVSSLLKLFIRSLPDALLPSTFYNNFIEADKCNKGENKLKEIKYLLHQLPVYSYETLKHIIRHLHRISKNCDVNLMEPKNLAIIFGPSIIRTPNETLEIAVKDMKHQCCIVELLVSQYEYFFESGAFPQLSDDNSSSIGTSITTQQQQEQQESLLLGNVQKIERKYNLESKDKESVASRFIPHLRRRSQSKRSTINSDTYSGESILSLECKKSNNDQTESSEHGSKDEGGSLEISISLTDEESSNSRISDSGSMSLTTITDTLDTKLRNLRSTSESQSDENDSPNKQQQQQQQQQNNITRRNVQQQQQLQLQPQSQQSQQKQQQQPLVSHENIPFADESPERPHPSLQISENLANVKSGVGIPPLRTSANIATNHTKNHHQMKSSNIPKLASSNLHHYHHHHHHNNKGGSGATATTCVSCSDESDDNNEDDDDSEVSTTSDPKESILISPLIFEQRYKKRNKNSGSYNKLVRSASFNCRNYSANNNKHGMMTSSNVNAISSNIMAQESTISSTTTNPAAISSNLLTKDEKTDMNYTKKRQIQNKQNRSIKRRHTVGGPSDYSATITRRTTVDNDHVLEVGIRIKNVNRRKNLN